MPGTNRFASLFQEFGGLSLHHRALLVETAEEVAFYAVHMCSIAETKTPGQGADRSVGLKPNAGRQARLKAGAQRTLEAVACTPMFGPVLVQGPIPLWPICRE